MKTFEELTHEEILALDDAGIQRYCDLACAQEGASLLPPEPGEKPEKPEHEPDVPVFQAGGEHFTSQEAAIEVSEAINRGKPISWSYAAGYGQKKIDRLKDDAVTVYADRFFSARLWEEVKGEMLAYKEAVERWEEEKKEYDDAMKARSRVTEWIWERISDARETERQKEKFSSLLSRYVELADGDEATARKFLLQAHPDAEEFLGDVEVSEKCPDGLLPDGPECPRCGGVRAPSGIDGGTWVHMPVTDED